MHQIRLLSKVRLPQRRPDTLRRARLLDFLHQAIDKRLTLVCAAAGYGKTALLVDFVYELDIPVCWLSMDASDSDARSFVEYLLLSIRQRFPEFGGQTEAILAATEDPDSETTAIVASLTNAIQTEIPEFFLIVLDDYHWASDSAAVNSILDQLVAYLPDNCRIVVSTRTLPRITYSLLAAQRQVAGLGTADLRFTSDELARLLQDNFGMSIPGKQLELLLEASEGWITGILLTARTPQMGLVENLITARKADSPLFDYLANEAHLRQPPEVQRFLLYSSVLDHMTASTCDGLFAGGNASEMLRYLVKANLFITEIEGPEGWYRYHNLFQDYLRAKLKAEEPEMFVRLHRRAAVMAEEREEWNAAFNHYLAAEDNDAAARLIERASVHAVRSGHWRTLYRWFEEIPSAIINERPALALHRGRTYLWAGEPERAILYLDRASERFRLLGSLEEASSALTLKATGLRLRGRLTEALDACAEALALQSDPNSRTAAEAHRVAAICLASQGKLAEADTRIQQALAIYEALGDSEGIASTCHNGGIIAARAADLNRGLAYFQRALDLWRCFGSANSVAGALNCIATVHYQNGDYDQAIPLLDEALAKAREAGSLRSEAFALAGIGDVRRDSGNARDSIEFYEAALDIARRLQEASLVGYLLDALGNTYRLLGDLPTAEQMLVEAAHLAEEGQSPVEMASCSISLALLAEERGETERALGLLRSSVDALATTGAIRELARARFHLSRRLLSAGDEDGAARELKKCLELTRQLGYDQFMVAEGRNAGPLLAWALARGLDGQQLERVAERLQRAHSLPDEVYRRPRIREVSTGPTRIEAYALGQTRVLLDSTLVKSGQWAVEKTKELFFFLLEHPQGLRKEQIADALWPEFEPARTNSHFHSTMYRLRRALFPQCVSFQDGRYQLNLVRSHRYDVDEFESLLSRCQDPAADRDERIERYERAIELYGGPFLEEFYSDWILPRREQLETRYIQALIQLARLKAETGALDQAGQLLQTAIATDPFQEDAQHDLVYYAALQGDTVGALRHYRRYADMLRDELDATPGSKVQALVGRITRGSPIL